MSPKRPSKEAALSWMQGGEEHQPAHQARMKKPQAAPAAPEQTGVQIGRPKVFEGPTERLNLMLPASVVQFVKQEALDRRVTPGQVVAELLEPHMKTKK